MQEHPAQKLDAEAENKFEDKGMGMHYTVIDTITLT